MKPTKIRLKTWIRHQMRLFLTIVGITFSPFLKHDSCGDVIYLRNGKLLIAERSWEEGNKIRYEKDGNIYGFSKELVERIEIGPVLPHATKSSVAARPSLGKFIPIELLKGNLRISNSDSNQLSARIIKDGKIDLKLLAQFENQARNYPHDPNRQESYQSALVEVIEWQLQKGDQAAAMLSLQQYLRLDSNSLQASLALGTLYLKQGQYVQAENILSQAQIRNNNSAELNYLLGTAYYLQDKNDLASVCLRHSLAGKFRPEIKQMLRKIEEEKKAENDFKQAYSLHFVIRYEGTERNHVLGREILASLETSFAELQSDLNYSPRESMAVILYPDEVFQDLTRTPHWVGAINDGKIRMPLKGITRVDESLRKILKHELTHSFIRLKTAQVCPVWLDEGLAQYMAGESSRGFLPIFKKALSENKFVPLSKLEVPFASLPYSQASLAYQESLLATDFLIRSYGISEVRQLLEQLATSGDFEAAMKNVLGKSRLELEKEFQDFISRR